MGVLMLRSLCAAALVTLAVSARVAALELNAGKYGAMFYWWYEALPETTIYRPSLASWDARDAAWWNAVVKQADDAGLGWIAADAWGEDTTADPAALAPLLSAIDRSAPRLKVALFDDTTSEVLRKNRALGYGWSLEPRFDLADLEGRGEGGLVHFYDHQWKPFFQTVPARYRLTIDGRPVVFMWHGGFEWYSNQNFFHRMLAALREATRRDFGVNPFVIVEESWLRLDPATEADAMYDWFAPPAFATIKELKGMRVANLVPGYDCSRCNPPGHVLARQNGATYQAALQAAAVDANLVLIDGLNNVDENAHLMETSAWGRLYLTITKWFAANLR
jgi:hypothetical protein